MTDNDVRSHFSLRALPFTRELPISSRWHNEIFEEPLEDLLHTIRNRMSATLIAPSGTGKTVLLRAIVAGLPEAQYRVHYVKVVDLSKRDLCREIATVVGLDPVGTYPNLVRKLQDRFQNGDAASGLRSLLIFDDAHDARREVLSILRVLTNYKMDSQLVLGVLLAGQPRLHKLMASEELEAVRQRIAHHATLRLLGRGEARDYMTHRMDLAGSRSSAFEPEAVDAVYEITLGNLRAIDHLALKSLETAARQGVPIVDATIVLAARKKLL